RRNLLAGTVATLAAPALIGSTAHAQAKQVIVGAWGGDFGRLLHENVDVAVMAPLGYEVTQDIGGEEPRAAKMQVQRRLARGNIDVACCTAPGAFQLAATGVLEELDEKKVPNLAKIPQNLRTPTAAPQFYSPQVLIYEPSRVTSPPL